MIAKERVRHRIEQLIRDGQNLLRTDGRHIDNRSKCSAWLTAVQNVVHILCPSQKSVYRSRVDVIVAKPWSLQILHAVSELHAILQSLLVDADAGLLSSVADQASAETFDDFLDHATAYLADSRKSEAGVIAGVVFEDSLRRICRKQSIVEKDIKLDQLISALSTIGTFSAVKAKRARSAAHVRTKATHAQWEEFDLLDVESTISFTRELIATHLDS